MSDQKDKLAAKKAAVLKKNKRKITPVIIVIAFLIPAIAGVWVYSGSNDPSSVAVSTQSEQIESQVTYPVSMFDDGMAQHFQYKDGSTIIRYFILKSSDGVVRAAFDACDVCWPSGKGYYQDGNDMVCANCGQRFSSVLINEVKGGCNPEPLARNVSGDNLIIRVEDILYGKKYFTF
jgi:uncharacterized membrane protein